MSADIESLKDDDEAANKTPTKAYQVHVVPLLLGASFAGRVFGKPIVEGCHLARDSTVEQSDLAQHLVQQVSHQTLPDNEFQSFRQGHLWMSV